MSLLLEQFVEEILNEINAPDLISSTSQKVQARASRVTPSLSRVDRRNQVWHFRVPGSEGHTYIVKVKIPHKTQGPASSQDIHVSCDCGFSRWSGPEHWGRTGKFLFQRPRGTASFPSIRDPNHENTVCKHVVAALKQFSNFQI